MKRFHQKSIAFATFAIAIAISLTGIAIFNSKKKHDKDFDKHQVPNDWYAYQRAYPHKEINLKNYISSLNDAASRQSASKDVNISWELAGPTNIGGRITDIEVHPNSPSTLYVGAATGGIMKSTDNGMNWQNIFSQYPTITIGDLAIDPENENIIYAGTGEANASSYSFFGSGMYKSTDAGLTWQQSGLETSAYIGRVIIDHSNSERLFVASCGNLFTASPDRGVYRSTNSGEDWEQVLFISDSTAAIDIVQHPTQQNTLYAAMWERMRGLDYRQSFGVTSGIWKTTDGGDNWTELTNGLPSGTTVGRIGIDISKSNPNVLYAIYDIEGSGAEVYKTTDGGSTWSQTNDYMLGSMYSSFGWYFGQIRIDPLDENHVFAMGVDMFETSNGGSNWNGAGYEMHVDHHAMEFDEVNNKIWQGNDGGLYYSTNNGSSWTKVNNLALTQFYDIAIDYNNPERLYGGTQDNNSIRTPSGALDDWEVLLGGDGMYCLVDYTNPNIYYCEYQWGGLYRFENNYPYDISWEFSSDRTNWSTPYVMHPTDPNTLYLGTYRVWKTTNKGDNWTSISNDLTDGINQYFHTITSIDISKLNPNLVIVGTGDGHLHKSTDAGATWNEITNDLPNRWVTRVKTDPIDENTIYATFSGFRWDVTTPHVFKSTDLGATWTDISGDLPEIPVNTILLDPEFAGRIIVGTDAGVYITEDNGESWHYFSVGIPNVPVTTMEMHEPTRKVVLGTYGCSMFSTILPVESVLSVDIKELEASSNFKIYPNPLNIDNQDLNIEIQLLKAENITISIFDLKGHQIYEDKKCAKKGENSFTISKADLSSNISQGTFFCKIDTESKKYTKKLILK